VYHEPLAAEERVRANTLGAIDDLVRDDEVTGGDLLTEGANGREGDDSLDTDGLESGDVCSNGNFRRRYGVCWAVARNEGDEVARGEGGDGDRGRRLAPRLCISAARESMLTVSTWIFLL
jgi:hypothetical protein